MSGDSFERRRFPRIASAHALLARRVGEESELEELSRTRTVGQGGCMFPSREPFGLGALVELVFTVRRDIIRAYGRVVHEARGADGQLEVGVEFLDMPEGDRRRLDQLFARSP